MARLNSQTQEQLLHMWSDFGVHVLGLGLFSCIACTVQHAKMLTGNRTVAYLGKQMKSSASSENEGQNRLDQSFGQTLRYLPGPVVTLRWTCGPMTRTTKTIQVTPLEHPSQHEDL